MTATMTPEQAEWVRDHVFTKPMRKCYAETPGYYTMCACQSGMTTWCDTGVHHRCHRATPLPRHEGFVDTRGGVHVAYFTADYEHPTLTATGRFPTRLAQVWLADRVCRWVCPCPCHSAPAAPEQLDLLEVIA